MMLDDRKHLWLWGSVFLFVGVYSSPMLRFEYHKYTALSQYLHDVATAYPNITSLYSIGETLFSKYLQYKIHSKKCCKAARNDMENDKTIYHVHSIVNVNRYAGCFTIQEM
jgi:hypothetical protein